MPNKQLHVAMESGIFPVADDVLGFQAHSGLADQVCIDGDRAWVAAAHGGQQVGGQTPTANGTPCTVTELNAQSGEVLHRYLFEGVGATTPGSTHHPARPDNHNQPQVLIAPDGHLIAILTGHDTPIVVARSVEPRTIRAGFVVRALAIKADRPNCGATYTSLALVGAALHLVYRSTYSNYSFDLCHVAVDTTTLDNTEPVTIDTPSPHVEWGGGRKQQWYHDLIAVGNVLAVSYYPLSAPTGFKDTVRIVYPRQIKTSKDNGVTWR